MKKLALLATVSLLVSACGGAAAPPPRTAASAKTKKTSASAKTKKTAHAKKTTKKADKTDAAPATTASRDPLQVGDYFVQRFSGSFSKQPMTLTERVVAEMGSLMVIDYNLDAGKHSEHLRVARDVNTGNVARVIRIDGDKAIPSDITAYNAMMDRTVFSADDNLGTLGKKSGTCLIGHKELDCTKTRYKVLVGDKPAMLSVETSKAVPGRAVAGELSTADGKLLYRAEIIDMGHGTGHAVAEK